MSDAMEIKFAEVNGTKPKSLRCSRVIKAYRQEKSRARTFPLLDSRMVSMGVLSNDFAAVDVREELCYHSLTEKANSECISERKPAKKKAPIIVGACR